MIGMVLPCDFQILMNLFLERFRGIKSYRPSNTSLESNLQRPPCTVRNRLLGIRKHVGFALSCFLSKSRVGAHEADRRHPAPTWKTRGCDIDPIGWKHGLGMKVRGWCAQCPPPLLSGSNPPQDLIASAKKRVGELKIRVGQCHPDTRTGYPFPSNLHVLQHLHFEAQPRSQVLQQRRGPGAMLAKTKICAHHQTSKSMFCQKILNEFRCRSLKEA